MKYRNFTPSRPTVSENRSVLKAPSSHASQSSNLDLLRAVAVLLVVFGHFVEYSGVTNSWLARWKPEINQLTYFAVLMFFIHTSLVLMMSISRIRASGGRSRISAFYVRRAARIYSLAILTVVVCYALHLPRFPTDLTCGGNPADTLSNLLLTTNLTRSCVVSGPPWSLPFEVQMYLLLPLIYLIGKRLKYPIAIMAGAFAVWYISRKLIPGDILRFTPWFSMGIYAFFRRTPKSVPGWAFLIALISLLAGRVLLYEIGTWWADYLIFALGIAFCHVLPACRDMSGFITRPAAYIAKYSYGIYLVHAPLMWLVFVKLTGLPNAFRIPVYVILVFACSVLLYHTLEWPLTRAGARLSRPAGPNRRTILAAA